MTIFGGNGGYFQNLSQDSETLYMTIEGLGELFKGDSAVTRAERFLLKLMGGQAEGLACADPGVRPSKKYPQIFSPVNKLLTLGFYLLNPPRGHVHFDLILISGSSRPILAIYVIVSCALNFSFIFPQLMLAKLVWASSLFFLSLSLYAL
jgi:hypothetical protein